MNEDIFDAAFELARDANTGAAQAELPGRLQDRFPHAAAEMISQACSSAVRLHDMAYDVADKHRDAVHSEAAALVLLREGCPGFSERTYKSAFAQGMFESR
jgi:hypothetical protein